MNAAVRFFGGATISDPAYNKSKNEPNNPRPVISNCGRKMGKTWTLLGATAFSSAKTITLKHSATEMKWNVGDRLVTALTDRKVPCMRPVQF